MKIGSNQFKTKQFNWLGVSKKAYNSILWLTLLTIVMGWSFWYYLKPAPLISPVIDQSPSGVCVTCRQGISKEELTIENMIKDIFKEDSGKAFKLLSCENERLRPNAVNVNKDGSQDLGIFQLNSNWHGFNKPVNNKR